MSRETRNYFPSPMMRSGAVRSGIYQITSIQSMLTAEIRKSSVCIENASIWSHYSILPNVNHSTIKFTDSLVMFRR